jgi:hypothetical protein
MVHYRFHHGTGKKDSIVSISFRDELGVLSGEGLIE